MAKADTKSDDRLDVEFADDLVLNLEGMAQEELGPRPPLPQGTYDAIVSEAIYGTSKAGRPQIHWIFRLTGDDPEVVGRVQHYYTTLDSKVGQQRYASAVTRINPEADLSELRPADTEDLTVDRPCRIRLKPDSYNGRKTNKVSDVLSPREDADTWLDD